MTTAAPPRMVRVAVYARASVSRDLEFDSVTAQAEAIRAYIASQRSSGWVALPEAYIDDGYSGGDVARPAFQRLMADVEAGRVDAIGCYKLDRVSRSLFDFARIVEALEKRGVALFSVTQQFSTQTSLGKLTLGILMSFAQFERETIAERIRDKMQATRRRGAWTGGKPVLGYDVVAKKLVVNKDEAIQVRATLQLYLELGSLRAVVEELQRRGWHNKPTKRNGQMTPGFPFTKVTLHALLNNTLYRGLMRCGTELVPGQHEAIVDAETWDAVKAQLSSNRRSGGAETRNKGGAVLRGLVVCGRCGSPMLHVFSTRKRGRRYRYYTCAKAHNEGVGKCPKARVAAGPFEQFVVDQIKVMGTDDTVVAKTAAAVEQAAEARQAEIADEKRLLRRRRVGDHHDLDPRHEELDAETQAIDTVDPEALRVALAGFQPVWDQLFPREQERILRLLIERVTYFPDDGDVDIELRPCGIDALAAETKENA